MARFVQDGTERRGAGCNVPPVQAPRCEAATQPEAAAMPVTAIQRG